MDEAFRNDGREDLFLVEVFTMDTNGNEGIITKTFDYNLILDKVRREIVLSQKGDYAGLGAI